MAFQNSKIQMAFVGLALVLTLVLVGNQQAFLQKTKTSGRAPASLGSFTMASTSPAIEIAKENKLAGEAAQPNSQRTIASVGQPADDIENLRFGVLEGKYAFKMDGDKISDISYIVSEIDKPTVISDRTNFLAKYAEQFGATSRPQRLSSVLRGDKLIETYKVKSETGEKIIQLTLGESNSFLALHTEKAPVLRLF